MSSKTTKSPTKGLTKTSGQKQQAASTTSTKKAGSQRLQDAGQKSAGTLKRPPPRERQTPSPNTSKKNKTASSSPGKIIGDLAEVAELEETTPATSIESANTDATSVTTVNESSSETPNPDAEKGVNEQLGGKDEPAGKDVAGDVSDSSGKADESGDSDDDIIPTPVKKQSGIERLQRGRQIKASSPAGITHPSRTGFDLLFDLLKWISELTEVSANSD